MLGATIAGAARRGRCCPPHSDGGRMPDHAPMSVKEAVLPFKRFRTREGLVVDSLLGPEMRSTGEVMGIDTDFGSAFAKAQLGAIGGLPDERDGVRVDGQPRQAGDDLPGQAPGRPRLPHRRDLRHRGRAAAQRDRGRGGAQARRARAPSGRAAIVDLDQRRRGRHGRQHAERAKRSARADGYAIRAATTAMDKPIITTVQQLAAAVQGIEARHHRATSTSSRCRTTPRDLDLYGVRGRRAGVRRPARRPGHRRAHRDPAGRRLPPPHPRRAGCRRAGPPGPVRRARRRRRRPRRTCCGAASRSTRSARRAPTAAPSTSSSRPTGRARSGSPGCALHDPVDVVGPLGRPFPLPAEPVPCVLVGGGYGCAPLFWLAEAAARARLPRRDGARRGRARTASSASSRRGARPTVVTRDHRRRLGRHAAAGSATCCGEVIDRTGAGVVYGCGPMAHAALGHRDRRRARRGGPGRGRGVDGLRRRGLHDLRHAGHRQRRRRPGWCARASRARSSAATGCAGTRSATASAGCPADAVRRADGRGGH